MIVYQTPSKTAAQNRKQFHILQRTPNEGISEWFKRLQKCVGECEFEQVSDYMLIDKFMSGLGENDFLKISQLPRWTVEELILVVIGNSHIFSTRELRDDQKLQGEENPPNLQLFLKTEDTDEHENQVENAQIKVFVDSIPEIDLNDSYSNEPNEDNSVATTGDDSERIESPTSEKTPLTKKEKNQRYFAKFKETGRYDEYRKKKAECMKQRRLKAKNNEQYLPPEIQLHIVNERRRTTRERVKRWRDRAKQQRSTEMVILEKFEPIEDDKIEKDESSRLSTEPEHVNEKPSKPKTTYVRKRTFQCYICSLNCSKLYELKTHLNLFHPSKERTVLQCPHCPKTTISRVVLSRHLKKCHSDLEQHKCECCEEEFSKRGDLAKHLQLIRPHHKPFICETCGNCFKSNSELKSHHRRHTGQKFFKCDICDLPLATRTSYKNHMLIHSGQRPHECKECDATFTHSSSLRKHMMCIHNPDQKPFLCTTCGKRFASVYHLRLHSYSHTGERPYRCELCGRNFSQATTLKLHTRRIHERQQTVQLEVASEDLE